MAKRLNIAMGRPSVFRDKQGGARVQGMLTKQGIVAFNLRRKELAKLMSREAKQITEADVIEWLARGDANTRDYLAGLTK